MVHRLVVDCKALTPATRSRWAASVRSWREPWLQVLWVYDLADANYIEAGKSGSHLLIRDASLILSRAEWLEWKARGFPTPLIKDLFQFKCLHMFGGWWADMDYFNLRAKPPAASWSTLLLGSEYERRTSSYSKSPDNTINLGGQSVSINLGIMWAERGSPLLMEAQHKARALWQKGKVWHKDRYLDHQLLIHREFAVPKRAEMMNPMLTSPFPRWYEKWQSQSESRQVFGVKLPSMETIRKDGFACNVWDGWWSQEKSDELVKWTAEGSGVSPSGSHKPEPETKMPRDQVAEVLAASVPTLTTAGVPIVIAFRTVAAALLALGYRRDRSDSCLGAPQWSIEQWAGVYLLGGLKFEWGDQGESSGVTSFDACYAQLKAQLAPDIETKVLDCAFMDAKFIELNALHHIGFLVA